MVISEAIKRAIKKGQGIARKSDGPRPPIFIPTNTDGCVLVLVDHNHIYQRWNPTLDDLSADDWYVTKQTELNF